MNNRFPLIPGKPTRPFLGALRVLISLSLVLTASVAIADVVTIDVTLDSADQGTYRLTGQSAFIQTRTNSGTSGAQLDNVESGNTSITFTEVFPPPTLSDYLGFAYFGIIETRDAQLNVTDTSLIVAYAVGSGVGETVTNTFPYTEAELVNAFTTSVDSPQFLNMLDLAPATANTLGVIAVPPIGRVGTLLDLVAFIGGPDGDLGVKVGTLSMTVVPEPSTFVMLVLGIAALAGDRLRKRFSRS